MGYRKTQEQLEPYESRNISSIVTQSVMKTLQGIVKSPKHSSAWQRILKEADPHHLNAQHTAERSLQTLERTGNGNPEGLEQK